jgi:hypothetical protein
VTTALEKIEKKRGRGGREREMSRYYISPSHHLIPWGLVVI